LGMCLKKARGSRVGCISCCRTRHHRRSL
jgi:hypothetical protein